MKEYFDNTPGEREKRAEHARENCHLSTKNGQRHKPDFWKAERTKYTSADAYEFGTRVASGRTITSVEKDFDMPNRIHIKWMRKRDVHLDKWFREKVDSVAVSGLSAKDRANRRGGRK